MQLKGSRTEKTCWQPLPENPRRATGIPLLRTWPAAGIRAVTNRFETADNEQEHANFFRNPRRHDEITATYPPA